MFSGTALAHECKPRIIPEAEFGSMTLGGRTACPSLPKKEEQSCALNKFGVSYGISEGLIVNKEIRPKTYSGKLPFNLVWGEKLERAVQKIDAITGGKPPLFIAAERNGYRLSTDSCLANKVSSYGLTMSFDKAGSLVEITGQILYP